MVDKFDYLKNLNILCRGKKKNILIKSKVKNIKTQQNLFTSHLTDKALNFLT